MYKVKSDCRYFLGDRPCKYHKQKGIRCSDCNYYSPKEKKILIIKLEAAGDVLRTTSILKGLKEKYKDCYIYWVVQNEFKDLLRNNPYIDQILVYGIETLTRLQIETFDLLINLDVLYKSCALATLSKAEEKKGFGLDQEGNIFAYNIEAEEWLKMSLFDDLKKANTETYQQIILEITGIKPRKYKTILNLSQEDLEYARIFSKKNNIDSNSLIVGINIGGGGRWSLKNWTIEGYLKLRDLLYKNLKAKIILFGGKKEKQLKEMIVNSSSVPIVDSGSFNTLRELAALVNLCDLLVTGDTLAMHIALALRKKVVVLFGPTSSAEIELYGLGRKILPHIDCLCCYKESCNKHPSCMEMITAESVFDSMNDLLK